MMPRLTARKQNKQGKVEVASSSMRRGWWRKFGRSFFPTMAKAAQILLSAHATTGAAERNWSAFGSAYTSSRNAMSVATAAKAIFVKHSDRMHSAQPPTHTALELDVFGLPVEPTDV